MTREEALTQLTLPPSAGKEEIEQAYQRMVRRYPPVSTTRSGLSRPYLLH